MVKLTAKKIYCPKCKKLSRVKVEHTGEKNQFSCIKCGSVIWIKTGLNWKFFKAE